MPTFKRFYPPPRDRHRRGAFPIGIFKRLSGAVAVATTVVGALAIRVRLKTSVSVSTSVSGTLHSQKELTAAAVMNLNVSGALTAQKPLVGAVTAQVVVTGALTRHSALSGSVAVSVSVAGALQKRTVLKGLVSVGFNVAGALAKDSPLAGAVTVTVTVAAFLTTIFPPPSERTFVVQAQERTFVVELRRNGTAMKLKTFPIYKDPDSKLDYLVDWTNWLATDEIIFTSAWTIPDELTQPQPPSHDTKTAKVWLGGGVLNAVYNVVNSIVTDGGRTEEAVIQISIAFKF